MYTLFLPEFPMYNVLDIYKDLKGAEVAIIPCDTLMNSIIMKMIMQRFQRSS